MPTILDSNVILDLLYGGSPWNAWSRRWISDSKRAGTIIFNAVVFAEASANFQRLQDAIAAFGKLGVISEDISDEAAYLAGRAHIAYRRRGGQRERTLPDFFIGAHATVKGYRILTRDSARYRSYFPSVALITPESHP